MTPQEAVKATSELLVALLSGGKRHNGIEYGRWFRRREPLSLEKLWSLFDPAKQDEFVKLIKAAQRGDRKAHADLLEWGALAVSCAGHIPPPLRGYLADNLYEQAEGRRRKRGTHPDQELLRDFSISYTVARVAEHGFSATRNPIKPRGKEQNESACSIVADALERVKVYMSESNVERIWNDRARLPQGLLEYIDGKSRLQIDTSF